MTTEDKIKSAIYRLVHQPGYHEWAIIDEVCPDCVEGFLKQEGLDVCWFHVDKYDVEPLATTIQLMMYPYQDDPDMRDEDASYFDKEEWETLVEKSKDWVFFHNAEREQYK